MLARSSVAERLLSPYLVAAQATPILALAPLIYLWFGSGLGSRVLICSLIVFFPIAVATMVGFRSVDAKLIELARSLRASRRQILMTFEIPGALPQILGGFRVGVTLAVVGAIVAEWAGADRGLGVLINLARGSLFDTPLLFATLLTIAVIGIVLYLVVALIERVLLGTLEVRMTISSRLSRLALPSSSRRLLCRRSRRALASASTAPAAHRPARPRRRLDGPSAPVPLIVGSATSRASSSRRSTSPSRTGAYAAAGLDVTFQNKIDPT